MMEYKGYLAKVDLDDEAGLLHGRVINIRDVVNFHATSVTELRQAFHQSVDEYLAFCAKLDEVPDKPFSGRCNLRLSPEKHRILAMAAGREGKSLNAWAIEVLERAASGA